MSNEADRNLERIRSIPWETELTISDESRLSTMMDVWIAEAVSEAEKTAWDEGYAAAENMSRMWGHVDHWEDEPSNPHRNDAVGGAR